MFLSLPEEECRCSDQDPDDRGENRANKEGEKEGQDGGGTHVLAANYTGLGGTYRQQTTFLHQIGDVLYDSL